MQSSATGVQVVLPNNLKILDCILKSGTSADLLNERGICGTAVVQSSKMVQ